MMIELRWIWRTMGVDENDIPYKDEILQYRTRINIRVNDWGDSCSEWSEWKDVPVENDQE